MSENRTRTAKATGDPVALLAFEHVARNAYPPKAFAALPLKFFFIQETASVTEVSVSYGHVRAMVEGDLPLQSLDQPPRGSTETILQLQVNVTIVLFNNISVFGYRTEHKGGMAVEFLYMDASNPLEGAILSPSLLVPEASMFDENLARVLRPPDIDPTVKRTLSNEDGFRKVSFSFLRTSQSPLNYNVEFKVDAAESEEVTMTLDGPGAASQGDTGPKRFVWLCDINMANPHFRRTTETLMHGLHPDSYSSSAR